MFVGLCKKENGCGCGEVELVVNDGPGGVGGEEQQMQEACVLEIQCDAVSAPEADLLVGALRFHAFRAGPHFTLDGPHGL